tara:strand:- start:2929 stop:4365 length:1437 start_codon:yes stop_codon:yes gene_type:complete
MSYLEIKNNLLNIKKEINNSIESEKLKNFFNYIEKKYSVEQNIIKQYFKKRYALSLGNLKPSEYNINISKYQNKKLLLSLIYFLGFKTLVFIKSIKVKKKIETKIIIDDLKSERELDRMISLFSDTKQKDKVFILRKKFKNYENKNVNIIVQEDFIGYSREIIKKNITLFDFIEIFYLIKYSFKSKLNLFNLYNKFLNDFLYFSSLYSKVEGRIIFQERILGRTNILKNYLFKRKYKGRNGYLQTHLIPYDTQALFFDCDIFFSMGCNSFSSIKDLDAKINEVVPIGSNNLNYYLLDNSNFSKEEETFRSVGESIDILFIGSNVTNNTRNNWEGYYETIRWLKKLSNDNDLSIFIKHHNTWIKDKNEISISSNSNINYLPQHLNTYYFALKADLLITYCSTLGIEIIPLNKTVYFTNPHNNNNFLNKELEDDKIVINTFEELEKKICKRQSMPSSNFDNYGINYKKTKFLLFEKLNKI